MTLLEAVNQCLDAIGETPVQSLSSGLADAEQAERIVLEVSKDVQSKGWHVNTDEAVTLTPDINGFITVPLNTLRVDTTGESKHIDVVKRGNRLYNRTDHTFVFERPLVVDLVIELDYADLPYDLAYFVAKRAARVYQERTQGSVSQDSLVMRAEQEARAKVEDADAEESDTNILRSSRSVRDIHRGYRPF